MGSRSLADVAGVAIEAAELHVMRRRALRLPLNRLG